MWAGSGLAATFWQSSDKPQTTVNGESELNFTRSAKRTIIVFWKSAHASSAWNQHPWWYSESRNHYNSTADLLSLTGWRAFSMIETRWTRLLNSSREPLWRRFKSQWHFEEYCTYSTVRHDDEVWPHSTMTTPENDVAIINLLVTWHKCKSFRQEVRPGDNSDAACMQCSAELLLKIDREVAKVIRHDKCSLRSYFGKSLVNPAINHERVHKTITTTVPTALQQQQQRNYKFVLLLPFSQKFFVEEIPWL